MTSLMEAAAGGGLTFARFFPSDWRTGCLALNLEEEGLYIRVCMFHYDTGKALPDDYSKCSQLLRVHPNKLRKVMDSLIEKGKIIRAQGILFNERVQEEIDKYRSEHIARALAAKKREEAKKAKLAEMLKELEEYRAQKVATPQTTPQTTQGYTPHTPPPVHYGVPVESTSKNTNKINETEARDCTYQKPEARSQKPEVIPLQLEQDAARASGGGYLDALNGTASDMVAFISKHAFVEPIDAQRMLTTNVKTFGTDAMMEAYSVTLANMGSSFISAPYKYLIETARRIKTSGKSQAVRSNPASEMAAKRERIKQHALEAAEAFERQRGRQ